MQRSIRPGETFIRHYVCNENESTGSHKLALLGANYITSQQSEGSQVNHVYQVTNRMINKDIEEQHILE